MVLRTIEKITIIQNRRIHHESGRDRPAWGNAYD
jgi:hypothetical protein